VDCRNLEGTIGSAPYTKRFLRSSRFRPTNLRKTKKNILYMYDAIFRHKRMVAVDGFDVVVDVSWLCDISWSVICSLTEENVHSS